MDFIKNCCSSKDDVRRLKDKPQITDEDATSATKQISDKGLVSRIYKELSKLSNKKTTHFLKKTKDFSKHLIKEHILMANEHMRKCSKLLITSKM